MKDSLCSELPAGCNFAVQCIKCRNLIASCGVVNPPVSGDGGAALTTHSTGFLRRPPRLPGLSGLGCTCCCLDAACRLLPVAAFGSEPGLLIPGALAALRSVPPSGRRSDWAAAAPSAQPAEPPVAAAAGPAAAPAGPQASLPQVHPATLMVLSPVPPQPLVLPPPLLPSVLTAALRKTASRPAQAPTARRAPPGANARLVARWEKAHAWLRRSAGCQNKQ